MSIELNGTTGITTPDVTSSGSLNIDASAPDDSLVVSSAGNVGINTSSPVRNLDVTSADFRVAKFTRSGSGAFISLNDNTTSADDEVLVGATGNNLIFHAGNSERVRIDSSGNLLVGKTALNGPTNGCQLESSGIGAFTVSGNNPLYLNRNTNDGVIVSIRQANVQEGSISVSGTTVSYNGGHLARWAQTLTPKDESLLKGTVLSNLDEMNTYTDADGNPVENEQLNKVKASDVEGDANVAGVFVNWEYDEAHNVDEINMAMTGDMIIRIAAGTTVARGDLLMSAGDGTAKPQGDDIVRSKTIAKVTSTNVTCTYEDGSFCVPCVLMAC